jgi:hypothetical protein
MDELLNAFVPEVVQHRQLSFDLNGFKIPNYTYHASSYAKYGSDLTSQDFSLTQGYFKQAISTAAALSFIGLVCLIAFLIALCMRNFNVSCKCLPEVEGYTTIQNHHIVDSNEQVSPEIVKSEHQDQIESQNHEERHHKHQNEHHPVELEFVPYPCNSQRIFWTIITILGCILIIIFSSYILVGNVHLKDGMDEIKNNVDDLHFKLKTGVNATDYMTTYGDDLEDEFTSLKQYCQILNNFPSQLNHISISINNYRDNVAELQSSITPVEENVSKIRQMLKQYSGRDFYLPWALSILSAIFLLGTICFRSIFFTKLIISLMIICFLDLIIPSVVWMTLSSILGDLCATNPTYTILTNIPNNKEDMFETFKYYSSCTGNCSITINLANATANVEDFERRVSNAMTFLQFNTSCINHLSHLQYTVGQINGSLSILKDIATCTPLQDIWFNIVDDAMCHSVFNGIFLIWGSHLWTSIFVFFTMIFATILYQYYYSIHELVALKAGLNPQSSEYNHMIQEHHERYHQQHILDQPHPPHYRHHQGEGVDGYHVVGAVVPSNDTNIAANNNNNHNNNDNHTMGGDIELVDRNNNNNHNMVLSSNDNEGTV